MGSSVVWNQWQIVVSWCNVHGLLSNGGIGDRTRVSGSDDASIFIIVVVVIVVVVVFVVDARWRFAFPVYIAVRKCFRFRAVDDWAQFSLELLGSHVTISTFSGRSSAHACHNSTPSLTNGCCSTANRRVSSSFYHAQVLILIGIIYCYEVQAIPENQEVISMCVFENKLVDVLTQNIKYDGRWSSVKIMQTK